MPSPQDVVTLAKIISQATKEKPEPTKLVDKAQWVKNFVEWFATVALTEEQILEVYKVVSMRVRSAVCHVCQQLKPKPGGILVYPGGDLGKPKVFVCEDCGKGLL